ncbi:MULTISPECIES: toll/interleukin-1 receptor domain-containing protein [Leptolyngbya]|uniref:toll/interleukin-1 receptor domain-containing protein n=1 Tax=Leptolyngbya TaxID=47251 RepID=UPI001688EAB1|nr:toll/interleukin-1 receptor domain-containing protein [Leptolyngbya sp. FACHB-1624]MBD1854484.1 toll/interleukin-1 receptor domain-containing protein [Leptolyngbya sp. FACHB-1624]
MPRDEANPTATQSAHSFEQVHETEGNHYAEQNVQQKGKYAINLGKGQRVHIGDRIIYQTDISAIRRIVREELLIHNKEYGEPIKTGLSALAELMQLPTVQRAVTAFRVDFQAAHQQIDVIADLKELHDQLHTLDQCYRSIARDKHLKTFTEDSIALESLIGYHQALEVVIVRVWEIANRRIISISKLTWLEKLEQAHQALQQAIDCLSVEHLQKTIWLLERVLAIQPSRINTSLNAAAGALRLPALITATATIWQQLKDSEVDLGKLSQFKDGVEALAELDSRLTALIIAHDYLQEMDLDLRRIEANLDLDLTELELSWSDLRSKTEMLFENQIDDWAVSFKQDCQNLNSALLEKNPAKIRRCFWSYQRQARHSFYKVDVTLKRLCDELRKVGEPLTAILRILE